jgi:general stress protein CsbA
MKITPLRSSDRVAGGVFGLLLGAMGVEALFNKIWIVAVASCSIAAGLLYLIARDHRNQRTPSSTSLQTPPGKKL